MAEIDGLRHLPGVDRLDDGVEGGCGDLLLRQVFVTEIVVWPAWQDRAAAHKRLLLAHDGAVPLSALLAAAATLGVRATVEGSPTAILPIPDATAPEAPRLKVRAVTMIGVALFVVLGAIDALVPAIRENRIVSVVLIGSVWSFFLLETYLNRKR